MIVTETDQGWRCITQPDHAHVSHEIFLLWMTEGVPEHPRRERLAIAIREHDNGWREADSAPILDPVQRRPHSFISHPREERFEIWLRGIRRFADESPYIAALIAAHASHLHAVHAEKEGWSGFLAEVADLQHHFAESAEVEAEEILADYKWLHLADLVSLAACARWAAPFERFGYQGRLIGDELQLDPFPFAGATTFKVPCRYLPRSQYETDSELAVALAEASWTEWAFRATPFPDAD